MIAEDRRARADEHAWQRCAARLARLAVGRARGRRDRGSRSCSTRRLAATSGSRRSRRAGRPASTGSSAMAYVELPLGDGLEEKVDALAGRGLREGARGAEVLTAEALGRFSPPPARAGVRCRPPASTSTPPTGGTASLPIGRRSARGALTGPVELDADALRWRDREGVEVLACVRRGATRRRRQLLVLRAGRRLEGADPVDPGLRHVCARRSASTRLSLRRGRSTSDDRRCAAAEVAERERRRRRPSPPPLPATPSRSRRRAAARRTGRRLRRLLYLARARDEPRAHVPADAEPCSPTGATCPSATTAAPGRSSSAARRSAPARPDKPPDADAPVFGPSRRLDIELELGFVVGVPSRLGEPIPTDAFAEHVFGVVRVRTTGARATCGVPGVRPARPVPRQELRHLTAWVTPSRSSPTGASWRRRRSPGCCRTRASRAIAKPTSRSRSS